jgi:ATP-dependent DNA helicase RecG
VIQRKRVVEEILRSVANGLPPSQVRVPAPVVEKEPVKPRPEVVGNLDSPIAVLKTVEPRARPLFARLPVESVRDLLHYYPTRHEEYLGIRPLNDLVVEQVQTIVGTVFRAETRFRSRRSSRP